MHCPFDRYTCAMQIQKRKEGDRDWRRTLELPAELREPLESLARVNERSTSAEIRIALRQHVKRAAASGDDDG